MNVAILPVESSIKWHSRCKRMRQLGLKVAIANCSTSPHITNECGWVFSFNMLLSRRVLRWFMVSILSFMAVTAIFMSRSWFCEVYIVSLYQNLGLTGGVPLIIGAAYVTVATLSNFGGAILLDRVGRKPLLSVLFLFLNCWSYVIMLILIDSRWFVWLYDFGLFGVCYDCAVRRHFEQCRAWHGSVFFLLFYHVLWRRYWCRGICILQ